MTIALIDDDEIFGMILQRIFGKFSIKLAVFLCVKDYLAQIESNSYDVLLCDLHLNSEFDLQSLHLKLIDHKNTPKHIFAISTLRPNHENNTWLKEQNISFILKDEITHSDFVEQWAKQFR